MFGLVEGGWRWWWEHIVGQRTLQSHASSRCLWSVKESKSQKMNDCSLLFLTGEPIWSSHISNNLHLVRSVCVMCLFARASNHLQTLVAIGDILGDWLT